MVMAAVLGGAFLGGLADRMKENREYTKKKSDETQAYLYNAGIKRQNEVMEARQQLTEAADYLDSRGMNTKKLTALLEKVRQCTYHRENSIAGISISFQIYKFSEI